MLVPDSRLGIAAIAIMPILARGYTMIPTWGHAVTFIPSPPAILIQGGKTSTSSDVYSSAPNTGDTIYLPLSSNFSTTSAPFFLLSPTSSPTYAWHCLAATSSTSGLVFGGDGGTGEAVQTLADSTWVFNLDSSPSINFTQEATGWGSQPTRRIRQSCSWPLDGGSIFICGGEKDDGSGATFTDCYMFDITTSTFNTLPSLPQGLFHHASVLLANGTLVVVGGAYLSTDTDSATLLPLSTIYVLDTSSTFATWRTVSIGGTVPTARRGATASLNSGGTGLLLYGGADVGLDTAYSDGWVLDLVGLVWTQVISTGPSARYDHSAVAVGSQVVIYGGYGSSAPADNGLYIYNTDTNTFTDSFDSNSVSSAVSSQQSSAGTSSATSTPTASSAVSASTTVSASNGAVSNNPSTSKFVPSSPGYTGPSSSASLASNNASASMLSTSAKIAIIVGVIIGLGAALFVTFLLCRRRRKQRGPYGYSPTRGGARPYGSREKGGQGLLDPSAQGGAQVKRSQQAALGFGSISAGLAGIAAGIRDRVGSGGRDAYAQLAEEGSRIPTRWPTRREGQGIRLVGAPIHPAMSSYPHLGSATVGLLGYSGDIVGSGSGVARTRSTAVRDSRLNMLQDEDRREFDFDEADEWGIDDRELSDSWLPAGAILMDSEGNRVSRYNDVPNRLSARIEGGPVPTPRASRDLNPFMDQTELPPSTGGTANSAHRYTLPAFMPSDPLDLSGLLVVPPGQVYSDTSLPRSNRSGQTTDSDASDDAVISHASIAHQASASLLNSSMRSGGVGDHGLVDSEPSSPSSPGLSALASPDTEETYTPIRRSGSFLQRMTGTLRFSRPRSGSASPGQQGQHEPTSPSRRVFDLRDPAPQPTLWPVRSTDDVPETLGAVADPVGSGSGRRGRLGHVQEISRESHESHASLGSVQSARTMRDMVVVVREPTDGSVATPTEVMVEDTPWHADLDHDEGLGSAVGATRDVERNKETAMDELGSVVFDGSAFKRSPPRPVYSRAPQSGSPSQGDTTPRALSPAHTPTRGIFNLAPVGDPAQPTQPTPSSISSISTSTSTSTPRRTSIAQWQSTPTSTAQPPIASPVPSPLVSHRRPVRDVVQSINRRSALAAISTTPGSGSSTPPHALAGARARPLSDVFSPLSQYWTDSPESVTGPTLPSATGQQGGSSGSTPKPRPRTTYEAVKRAPLTVANPDKRTGSGSSE